MNILKQAGQVLATFAPTVATALGGPAAGIAVRGLESVFGITPDTSPEAKQQQIEAALQTATPEQVIALKKLEQDFQLQMKQLGITEAQLTFTDLASARAMQVATKDPTVRQLAWLIIGGFTVLSLLIFVACIAWPEQVSKVSTAAWTLLTTLLTFYASEAKQAGAFFFGSSQSSQQKDATLAEIAKS